MNARILIRKRIKAQNVQEAMKRVRIKYPNARLICYRFDKDFRFDFKKDYSNRTMTVAFVDDYKKVIK